MASSCAKEEASRLKKAIDATKSEQKLADDDVSRSKDEVETEIKKHVAVIDEISAKKISEIEET